MKKSAFILGLLVCPMLFAQEKEPSEVKEIRNLYQKAKKEIQTTENKLSLNFQHRFTDDGEERERPRTKGTLNAYFSDAKKDQLNMITYDWAGSIDGAFGYQEYLFKKDLVFVYAKEGAEGATYELRCYFNSSQKAIHQKNTGEKITMIFDSDNPNEQCQELQQKATKLKNSIMTIYGY